MHDGRLAPKNLGFQLPDLKLEHINIPRLVTLWFCHMLLHISTIDRFRLWIYINMESVARSTYSSHSTSTAITDSYWSRLLIMFQSVIHVFARLNQVTNILARAQWFDSLRERQPLKYLCSENPEVQELLTKTSWTHFWTMALSIWKSSLGSVHVGCHIHQDYQASIGMV